jgi:hypothetical protein
MLISVSYITYMYNSVDKDPNQDLDTRGVRVYLFIEQATMGCIVFANVLFLVIRGVFKHKIDPESDLPTELQLPSIDTLIALRPLVNIFVNAV